MRGANDVGLVIEFMVGNDMRVSGRNTVDITLIAAASIHVAMSDVALTRLLASILEDRLSCCRASCL